VIPSTSPDDLNSPLFRITYSTNSLTVPAGASAVVTITFTALRYTAQQTAEFPIYSGFINIRGTSASQQVQVFSGASRA